MIQANNEERAVRAETTFETIQFNRRSRYTTKVFLVKINDCMEYIKVKDVMEGKTVAVDNTLLPSISRDKVDRPMYKTCSPKKKIGKKFKCIFYMHFRKVFLSQKQNNREI